MQKYDLEERTTAFAEQLIVYIGSLPKNTLAENVIRQLLRAATSIGANYCEADCAESKKDFKHKIGICKRGERNTFLAKNS